MKNIQLSERLSAVASLVEGGARVCDVGTDHGFVPIYLINSKRASHVVAMDVGEGPLSRAKEHVSEYRLESDIEIRLSDGLASLNENEADTMICAGMGGHLMKRILEEGHPVQKGIRRLVLQPQSDLFLFREFLYREGFAIAEEKEIFEEGKYYVVICARPGKENIYYEKTAKRILGTKEDALRICHRFGPYLLYKQDEVLKEYLLHELGICEKILLKLHENAQSDRERDIIMKKNDITTALGLF